MLDNKLVQAFHLKTLERLRAGRPEVLRNCMDNLLFYIGHQWQTFDTIMRAFRFINTSEKAPRPVVNLYKAKLLDVVAMLASLEPNMAMAPGSDAADDRITADMGKDVLDYLERSVNIEARRLELAYYVSILNDAYAVVDYDPEGGATEGIPRWECQACEEGESMNAEEAVEAKLRCPHCKGALGPSAEMDEIAQGALGLSVLTPFEVWVDYSIPEMKDQPAIIIRRLRTREWVRDRYGNKAAEDMERSEAGSPGDMGLTYLNTILRLAPVVGQMIGGSLNFENAVVVDDMYALPTKDFTKGLWARLTSKGTVLEAKKLPFHEGTEERPGKPIIPIAHFGYDLIPRSHIHVGPANDLKSPQRDYNRLLAHVKMYFARSANSILYLPQGIDVASVSGVEGLVLRGNTVATGGGKPERIDAGRIPTAFRERFEQILMEMEQITGLKDPAEQLPRLDSGYALQLLDQQRQRRLNPVFRRWGQAYKDLGTKLFHVFRNFAPEEVYHKIKGTQARWSTKKLRSADLRGGIDVMVEPESLQPKSLLQKQGAMERLINLGAVNPQEPQTTIAIARLLGATEFLPDLALDEEKISREHDAVKTWAQQFYNLETGQLLEGVDPQQASNFPILIDRDLDNHPLHAVEHRKWMLSEEFEAYPLAVQQAFRYAHYLPHIQIIQEQQAAAQEQSQPQRGKGGKPGEQTGQENEAASARGKGAQGRSEREAEEGGEGPPG